MNLILAESVTVGGGAAAAFGTIMLVIAVLGLVSTVFWVVGLVDVCKRDDAELRSGSKTLWIVLMVVLGILGTVAYWLTARPKA